MKGGGLCLGCYPIISKIGATAAGITGLSVMKKSIKYSSRNNRKKNNKNKSKKKSGVINRSQDFEYEDSMGEKIKFSIKQNNKKVTTIINNKKKIKNYKKKASASRYYLKKLNDCIKKGFHKC